MGLLFQLAKFLPRGRGRLSRIEEMLDRHSRIFEGIDAEDRATVRPNPRGSFTISASGSRGGGGSIYSSYFKVVDASTPGTCKVGVTDGGWIPTGDPPSAPTLCGYVEINGCEPIELNVFNEELTEDGQYWVWLHLWISATTGFNAEIRVGNKNVEDAPSNPNGGVAHGSILLGRIAVEGGAATAPTQDYLTGGIARYMLFGDCDGSFIECP